MALITVTIKQEHSGGIDVASWMCDEMLEVKKLFDFFLSSNTVGEITAVRHGQFCDLYSLRIDSKGVWKATWTDDRKSVNIEKAIQYLAPVSDNRSVMFYIREDDKSALPSSNYYWVQTQIRINSKDVSAEVGLMGADVPYAEKCLEWWYDNESDDAATFVGTKIRF